MVEFQTFAGQFHDEQDASWKMLIGGPISATRLMEARYGKKQDQLRGNTSLYAVHRFGLEELSSTYGYRARGAFVYRSTKVGCDGGGGSWVTEGGVGSTFAGTSSPGGTGGAGDVLGLPGPDLVRHDAANPRPRRPLVLTRSIQRPRSPPADVRGLWPRRYGGSFSGTG